MHLFVLVQTAWASFISRAFFHFAWINRKGRFQIAMVSIFVKDIMPVNLTYSMIPLDVSHSVVLSALDVLHSMLGFGVAFRIPHSFELFVELVLMLLSLMLWMLLSSRMCCWHSKDCVHQISNEYEFIGQDDEVVFVDNLEEAVFQ